MRTYQELNQNEIRDIKLSLTDEDGTSFAPSACTYTVDNSAGTTIVASTNATISTNTITANITTTVTTTIGEYKLTWTIKKDGSTYKHITIFGFFEL